MWPDLSNTCNLYIVTAPLKINGNVWHSKYLYLLVACNVAQPGFIATQISAFFIWISNSNRIIKYFYTKSRNSPSSIDSVQRPGQFNYLSIHTALLFAHITPVYGALVLPGSLQLTSWLISDLQTLIERHCLMVSFREWLYHFLSSIALNLHTRCVSYSLCHLVTIRIY